MARLALCFAPRDAAYAEELAGYLRLHTSLRVELAESRTAADFLDVVEQCLAHEFVIAIFSAASVPSPWPRSEWERVLLQCAKESECQIGYLLRETCAFPPVLRRKSFFESLGPLRQWLIHALHPERVRFEIAAPGEPDEALLPLIDRPGVVTGVKRAHAQWLMNNYWRDFENVYWVECARQTRAGILGEIAHAMNLRLPGTVDQNWNALLAYTREERSLFVFENLPPGFSSLGGKASEIVLVRESEPSPFSLDQLKQLFFAPNAQEAECLRALGRFMDRQENDIDWNDVKAVATRALLLLKREARLAEAYELLTWLAPQAKQVRDMHAWNQIRWEEDWILDSWELPAGERAVLVKTQPSQLPLPL